MSRARRLKFGTVALVLQTAFVLLFAFLAEYDETAQPKALPGKGAGLANLTKKYPPFQDVHVMIFIGFGFLMTFLKRYGYSAVGLNMFISALVIQWAMIVRGFINEDVFKGNSFHVVIDEMVTADFAAATVLISFGAVLGKTSPLQLMIMGIIEVVAAQVNGWVCHGLLHAVDVGESMYIHAFGAYFGLAVARVLYNKEVEHSKKAGSVYHSDIFSLIGTIFLWMYWPSFNGGGSDGDEQHRAYINTYLSLCSCTIVTFAFSSLYDKKGRFTAEFIQNATLAGGVAVGTTANMPLQPYGAILMGCASGFLSTTGYRFLSEFMADKLKIHDTCGVHNLHGMPGVLAAIAGAIMAAISSEDKWGRSLYEIFPETVPEFNTTAFTEVHLKFNNIPGLDDLEPGQGWSTNKQGGYQALALCVTLGFAIVSGTITGLVLKLPVLDQIEDGHDLFEDAVFWNTPDEEDLLKIDENGHAMTKYKESMEGHDNQGNTSNIHL